MILSIRVNEDHYFGDHGAMMSKVIETVPGETVEDLVKRAFPDVFSGNSWAPKPKYHESITIQIVEEAPKNPDDDPDPFGPPEGL